LTERWCAISAWENNDENVGSWRAGNQKKLLKGNVLILRLRFKIPMEATEDATTEPFSTTETKVKWGFNGGMDYPMNLMLPFQMDKSLE
jgi:hypothetical protein